jgi:calcium channel MID1
MSVHAPELPDNFTGVWNYELAVSIDDFYHTLDGADSNLFSVDTDSSAALLVTNNLTQANASSQSFKQWMELTSPFVVFASNANETGTMGLSNSFCGLNKNSQIVGAQDEADGNSTNVQMQMITRGLGNKPKEQFYVTALNRSSTYRATLAMVGNSTDSGQGVVGGGGKVWQTINFRTKTDGNCALLYNLDFCSEVAYAVPSTPDIVSNYTNFQFIYDNYALTYYHNFNYSLQQIPCHTTADAQYSLARNCADCAKAYKEWLCAVSIPRCEDFSNDAPHLHRRNMGQSFINGTMLASSVLEHPYTPMSDAPTLEGTVAYSQTYISSMATNSSRNPMIDNKIAPGPYKEILPCEDLCYSLMQSCPAALGFGCPFPGKGLETSYGKRTGNGNGSLSCSFLGAYIYTGESGFLHGDLWRVLGVATVLSALLVGM